MKPVITLASVLASEFMQGGQDLVPIKALDLNSGSLEEFCNPETVLIAKQESMERLKKRAKKNRDEESENN